METKLILIHNSFLLAHWATYANTVITNTARLQDATDTMKDQFYLIKSKFLKIAYTLAKLSQNHPSKKHFQETTHLSLKHRFYKALSRNYTSSIMLRLHFSQNQWICHVGSISHNYRVQGCSLSSSATCFSSRDELVSSFSSLGFFGPPFEPAAGIRTSWHVAKNFSEHPSH